MVVNKCTPPCTKCALIVSIPKCKYVWDFDFHKYHQWIYTSGNENWIPLGHRAAFIAYMKTNIFPEIT